jgi:hypothetical protein
MKISKSHQNFAIRLSNQDILNHPENYLGSNWKEVINFWLYLDTLSYEQLKAVEYRYATSINEKLRIYKAKACKAAASATDYAYHASCSAYCPHPRAERAAYYTTQELIGLDKLLEQDYQLVFFPMFLNP